MLVLCYIVVLCYVYLIYFKHIQNLYSFVIFCQYTEQVNESVHVQVSRRGTLIFTHICKRVAQINQLVCVALNQMLLSLIPQSQKQENEILHFLGVWPFQLINGMYREYNCIRRMIFRRFQHLLVVWRGSGRPKLMCQLRKQNNNT